MVLILSYETRFISGRRICKGSIQGNPAAVVPLNQWLSPQKMQSIAQENNLSETASKREIF